MRIDLALSDIYKIVFCSMSLNFCVQGLAINLKILYHFTDMAVSNIIPAFSFCKKAIF